jgi:hypothetical protein
VGDTNTCSSCGAPAGRGADHLIPVVDELGRTEMCGLCLITVLARWPQSGDVTVFLARPTALQN